MPYPFDKCVGSLMLLKDTQVTREFTYVHKIKTLKAVKIIRQA